MLLYMVTFTINRLYPSHVSIYTSTMEHMGKKKLVIRIISLDSKISGYSELMLINKNNTN